MACCVVLMAVLSHFFAWRHRIRRAIGLPVETWDDEPPSPAFAEIWRRRFQHITRSTAGRAVLASAALAELTFLAVALPGANGLIATHREHYRQTVNFVVSLGHSVEAAFCGGDPAVGPVSAVRGSTPQ